MYVQFACPAGHKIRAKAELVGKTGKCPKCSAVVLVPEPTTSASKQRRRSSLGEVRPAMSESGVIRLLGDVPPLPPAPPPTPPADTRRACPRCKKSLPPTGTICSHCQLYVGVNALKSERPSTDMF